MWTWCSFADPTQSRPCVHSIKVLGRCLPCDACNAIVSLFFVVNDHSFCADSSRLNGFSLNEIHKWTTLFQPHLKSRRISVWEQRVLSLLSRHTKEYVLCIIFKPHMVHRVRSKKARASKILEIELNNNSFSRTFFLPFSNCKVFEGRWVWEFCLLASSSLNPQFSVQGFFPTEGLLEQTLKCFSYKTLQARFIEPSIALHVRSIVMAKKCSTDIYNNINSLFLIN